MIVPRLLFDSFPLLHPRSLHVITSSLNAHKSEVKRTNTAPFFSVYQCTYFHLSSTNKTLSLSFEDPNSQPKPRRKRAQEIHESGQPGEIQKEGIEKRRGPASTWVVKTKRKRTGKEEKGKEERERSGASAFNSQWYEESKKDRKRRKKRK